MKDFRMSNETNTEWREWSIYVLKELERLNECYEKLENRLGEIEKNIVMLQGKQGDYTTISTRLDGLEAWRNRLIGAYVLGVVVILPVTIAIIKMIIKY